MRKIILITLALVGLTMTLSFAGCKPANSASEWGSDWSEAWAEDEGYSPASSASANVPSTASASPPTPTASAPAPPPAPSASAPETPKAPPKIPSWAPAAIAEALERKSFEPLINGYCSDRAPDKESTEHIGCMAAGKAVAKAQCGKFAGKVDDACLMLGGMCDDASIKEKVGKLLTLCEKAAE